tara:strand:- start:249 stop:452 length:204 start_codon:yes stop_codon:yes gene_type:complete
MTTKELKEVENLVREVKEILNKNIDKLTDDLQDASGEYEKLLQGKIYGFNISRACLLIVEEYFEPDK